MPSKEEPLRTIIQHRTPGTTILISGPPMDPPEHRQQGHNHLMANATPQQEIKLMNVFTVHHLIY